jgi:hypothetical protein
MSKPPIVVTLTFDPAEMARRGRIGAYRLHATHDSRETTQAARATFLARFEREVDPDGTLAEAERQRRAEHARKAYFARLALKSARTRAKKRGQKATATVVETVTVAGQEVRCGSTDSLE